MNWYIETVKKYADFKGRARRKEYWYFFLFNSLISSILVLAEALTGNLNPDTGFGLLSGLFTLAILIPSLAVSVRRLHDVNRSGWWLLIVFIPIIGAIVFLVFSVTGSKPDENQYGVSPKLNAV